MPRRTVLCAGTCGRQLNVGKGSLPEGRAMCHECRRQRSGRPALGVRPTTLACVICGTEFPFALGYRRQPRKLCDDLDCRRELQRRLMAERNVDEHPCPDCGGPSTRAQGARCQACQDDRVRANWATQNKRRHAIQAEERRLRRANRLCAKCGTPITDMKRQKYCSDDCASPDPAPPAVRECTVCGQHFVGAASQKTCSPEHAAESKRRYDAEYNKRRSKPEWDRSERTCAHEPCSRRFVPARPDQSYCDGKCGRRAQRRRERKAGKRSTDIHRKRAKELGREYEPISPIEIFERDGWRCQIPECSMRTRKVKRDVKVPDPMAPTLDHIIPMALPGGDHLRHNVQCAHFLCNSRKREVIGDVQLALFG